jgi:hypothetical protein
MRSIFVRTALFAFTCSTILGCTSTMTEEIYPTLQACVVDHTTVEHFTETQAITICLTSHLANINFTTTAECEAYVTANGGYPDSRVAACADYIANK